MSADGEKAPADAQDLPDSSEGDAVPEGGRTSDAAGEEGGGLEGAAEASPSSSPSAALPPSAEADEDDAKKSPGDAAQEKLLMEAISLGKRASALDIDKKYEKAVETYMMSIRMFALYARVEKSRNVSRSRLARKKAVQLMDRAEQIKAYLAKTKAAAAAPVVAQPPAAAPPPPRPRPRQTPLPTPGRRRCRADVAGATAAATWIFGEAKMPWSGVIGLQDAKDALFDKVVVPMSHWRGKRERKESPDDAVDAVDHVDRGFVRGCIIYGPAGCGKTHLSKTLVHQVNSDSEDGGGIHCYFVNALDLGGFRGDRGERVAGLFKLARSNAPALVVIDDFESCTPCGDGLPVWLRPVLKAEMSVSGPGVCVIGITNMPKIVLAEDWMRFFHSFIEVKLPDAEARAGLILNSRNTPRQLTPRFLRQMATRLEGYSAADFSTVVRNALMEPIRICQTATHFRKIRGIPHGETEPVDDMLTPCSHDDVDAIEMSLVSVASNRLEPPCVRERDFWFTCCDVSSSSSALSMRGFVRFRRKAAAREREVRDLLELEEPVEMHASFVVEFCRCSLVRLPGAVIKVPSVCLFGGAVV